MEDLVIRKKDIEKLGRKLMKEVYKFLHDEYILTFEEMKVEKDKLEKYLLEFYYKGIPIFFNFLINEKNQKEIEDKIEDKKNLKEIECKIEDESLNIDYIFKILNLIELHPEIDEDLFVKKKHLYIFIVYLIFIINI